MIDGFTQRDGYRLHHAAYGRGQAVLLLHDGASSSLALNHRKAATLVDWLWQHGYRAVTFDMHGYGRSTRVASFDNEFFAASAQDARAVLDHLEIDQAAVIGVGDGGTIALRLAADCPDRIRSVVADTAPSKITVPMARAARVRRSAMDGRRRELLDEMQGAEHVDGMLTAYADFLARLAGDGCDLLADAAEAIECPVLLLASEPEPLGLADQARDLAKRIGGSRTLVVSNPTGRSESVLGVAPSVFRAAVGPFLREQVGALVA